MIFVKILAVAAVFVIAFWNIWTASVKLKRKHWPGYEHPVHILLALAVAIPAAGLMFLLLP